MEPWQTILFAFGGHAALLAVLCWIAKSLLEKLIIRDTKQFESELKAKTDATIVPRTALVRLSSELGHLNDQLGVIGRDVAGLRDGGADLSD
jgi:hypothetical protein